MIETNFKHTDIGLIPHDWEVKELAPLCSKLCVGFVGTCEPYYVSAGRGVKMVRTGDLKDSYVDLSNTKFISYDFHRSHLKSQLKRGDILIARHGSNGHGVIYDSDAEANSLNIVILRTESISNKYIIYLLDSPSLRLQIEGVTAGSTQRVINTKEIAKLQIPLPPTLAEQEKIANALSKIDQLINDLGALIEKKKAIKQGTMQDLLTAKRRLKGFTGEWVKKNIWEVTIWDKKFNGVEDYKQPEVKKYPYALAKELFAMEDNSGDVFLLSTGGYSGWTTEKKAGQFMCHGEVVTIPWGGVAIVKYTNGKFVTADNRLATSKNTQVLSNKFLYLAMLIKTDVLNTFYRGASIKHPSMEDVLNLEIFLPPTIAEQNAIANVLSSMDTEITNLEQKRDKYIAIKQGMMQNLLTGKIRLI